MSDISDNKGATNYSVQPGYSKDYPPQAKALDPRDHPAYNVPDATDHHRGSTYGASASDMKDRGSTRAPLDEAMPTSPQGDLPYGAYN